ncbi:MAG: restriction endonuclease subunit S [Gallionella sp.]|nr:restriction endonuclease subunit S [Gallionella sp.]
MSEYPTRRLDEFIAEGTVLLGRGDVISKDDIEAHPGPYPIYSSSAHNNGKFGEYGKFMFDEELITWSVDGGGNFFYRAKHKYSVTNVCGYMRLRSDELHPKFVFYSLANQHRYLTFDYTSKAHPSVIKKQYWLPTIGREQQQKIATILTGIDKAIENTEALIAKYQQIKAGLMHDLFTRGVTANGKLRPPREQAPELYQETPLGWIPKEWEIRQLRELGDVITGNTPPEHTFSGDGRGIPFVTPGDVGNAIFVSETVRSVTPGLAGMARLIMPNSTCVVCIGSTIGKLALVSRESITNQQINSVLCQKRELSFLAYFTMDYFLPSQLRREAGLQAVPIVKKSVFEKLLVAWPIASEEAMEVQNKLLGVAAQLEAEEAVACKLRQQKLGLMTDLLTGSVRVQVAETQEGKSQ